MLTFEKLKKDSTQILASSTYLSTRRAITLVYLDAHLWYQLRFFSDFTGSATERGMDNGVNTNINYPLPRGTQDSDYCAALSNAIQDIKKFDPGYLLLRFFVLFYVGLTLIAHFISLGVDTFADDPISDFKLSHSCYTQIGRVVADL